MGNKKKETPRQKVIITIEGDEKDTIKIKQEWFPELYIKEEEQYKNHPAVVECFIRIMDALKGDKTSKKQERK